MRFHMGISFSWRTIKKYLFYIIFALLAFFGFSFLYDNKENIPVGSFLKVFAYENDNTSWNLTMPDYDTSLRNTSCGSNGSMYDVVNNIINTTSTDYYTLLVGAPDFENFEVSQISFYIKWKSSIQYNKLRYYGYNNGNYVTQFKVIYSSNTDRVPYYTLKSSTCDNYQNNADYQMYKLLTDTGNYSQAPSGSLGDFNYNNYESPLDTDFILSSLDNNQSYAVNKWFYYSTNPYTYTYLSPNSTTYYNKKLCITDNDTCYVENDVLPSYYDVHHNDTPIPTFIGYKTSLDVFYTNLLPSSTSNYSLNITFNVPDSVLSLDQDPLEYINNVNFSYICSGRVNHTNYYTYNTFPCSLNSSYTYDTSTINYTFNSFSSSTSLSSFDKIYITIIPNYLDNSINKTIYDLSYIYSLGSFYNTDYKGAIYEDLSSLPLNFRIYFSSNNSLDNSKIYAKKFNFINYHIKYIGFSNVSQNQNLIISSSIIGNTNNGQPVDFVSTNVSNSIDTGIMIYQYNGSILLPKLELFFNNGIVLSINNNLSSDTFYYIDNEGVIQNSNFSIPIEENTSNTSYDISYYIGVVNSFIDDLSQDSIEFSTLTQNFYNSMPDIFQTFIFVVFILICVYFTYLLIKR